MLLVMLMMLLLQQQQLLQPPMQLFCEGLRSSLQPCLHAQQRRYAQREGNQAPHQKQGKMQQHRCNCDGSASLSTATADV